MKCKECGFRIRGSKKQSKEVRKRMHEEREHHQKKHPKLRGIK